MMPQPVAQPLHGGAGDEDRALERVRRAGRRGCSQATVVSSPRPERTGSAPVLTSTNEPVP